jgi:hypothetical protein
MLNTIVDNKDAVKKLRKLEKSAFPGAARNSLNNMAKGASRYARIKTLKKQFHLRNKWTTGSIIPKPGKNIGLIPDGKTNINAMFSVFGSLQPYLLQQEDSFRKKSPSIPLSKTSRKGGAFSGNVKPSLRMKKVAKNIRTRKYIRGKGKSRKQQTFAMLALSSRRGYQGFFFLDVPGVFGRGVYKFKTKRSGAGFPRMKRLRSHEKRSKSFRKRPWFMPVAKKFQQQKTYDFFWNREVKKLIDPIFKR